MYPRLAFVLSLVLMAGCGSRDLLPSNPPLKVTWGGTEGNPSCVYDAKDQTVRAKLAMRGTASKPTTVTVTVTAYADENTSQPVGSHTGSVRVDGRVDRLLTVTIPVDRAPHVDIDGVTACKLAVKSR